MSTGVGTFPPPALVADALRDISAREAEEDELVAAARALLAAGPVGFKISTRVPAERLGPIRRYIYVLLCRKMPARWRHLRVPPAPAMQQGFFDDWGEALKECHTPDDQLLVMPKNRTYSTETVEIEVECRPRDPSDARRFKALHAVFAGYCEETYLQVRLRVAEEYGRALETVMREATTLLRRALQATDDGDG
jgi:hypothetical protein